MAKKPTKTEIATMKVMADQGQTPKAIADALGRSNHTVARYLSDDVLQDDPVVNPTSAVKRVFFANILILHNPA